MYVELKPEPNADERQAVLEVLAREMMEAPPPTTWWRAGLEPPGEDDYAAARRQSRGATRA